MKHVTGKTHNKSNTFLKAIKITKKSYILQNKCELIQLFLDDDDELFLWYG